MSLYSGRGKRLAHGGAGTPSARGGKRLLRTPSRGRRAARGLLCFFLMAGGLSLFGWFLLGGAGKAEQAPQAGQTPPAQEQTAAPQETGTPAPIEQTQPPEEEPDRADGVYVLSFAGDCTLGTEHGRWGGGGTFPDVVGDDYAYPFSGVQELFAGDDFTFVNLECALTDRTTPVEKEFRFRGPRSYGQILTEGSVEAVSLANNHSGDYGKAGLADTRAVLEELGIAAGGDGETFLYTAERGLKVGVYTAYHIGKQGISQAVESLQAQGAEVIVAAFHSGTENAYAPTDWQRQMFRYAVDCGADIVYNSHPHVLQPIEYYGGGVILYSLGNFCFGGNRNPSDKDTAVIQVTVEQQEDGAAVLTGVTAWPCSVSSRSDRNDFRPTLCQPDSAQAERIGRKLDGTYRAPAPEPEESETAPEPEESDTAPEPDETAAVPGTAEADAAPAEHLIRANLPGGRARGTAPSLPVEKSNAVQDIETRLRRESPRRRQAWAK